MLFQGESQKDIAMVIQKSSGCNLIFEEEYHAIMNAAKYGEIAPRERFDEQSTNSDNIALEHDILRPPPIVVIST